MHDDLIEAVLDWLEDNIDKPITQTDVVRKSGYSQRYFQDIFFEITKISIAKYILARKLSLSSILLRLTKLSISEVSVIYSFNSQQSFSRAFKRHFKVTPIVFRNREFWDFKYYLTQHRFLKFKKIQCKPVFFNFNIYADDAVNKSDIFDVIFPFDFKSKYGVEGLAFKNKNQINLIRGLICSSNKCLCVSYSYSADEKSKNKIKVNYIIRYIPRSDFILNEDGARYYMFSFFGDWSEYIIFSNVVYTRELPRLNIRRRAGFDIEIFNSFGVYKNSMCSLHYFIPVF
ncbi:helix-turn-helix domain-containing protein [Morganella morganii]|uniref:helix-turn-helix domain-containing protein n=1 Tax=Morganella morganii TaxID=582 RepID=UPI001BDA104E|nr:helix-turn-helix domain-containing protein [Morganella morganii]MBT0364314.1 helix-turn-helix domain-containing protein [Morganella morganii subsp. morganii]